VGRLHGSSALTICFNASHTVSAVDADHAQGLSRAERMIASLKRLWRDRRGNALVIAGAALPVLVGAAGLATDTIQWALWKRELQRAADSAALAGVYADVNGDSATNAVNTDLTINNRTNISLRSGYPVVTFPTVSPYSNVVNVDLSIQKRLGFSSLFLSSAPIITTSARAALIDQGSFCLIALKKSGGPAITMGGNSTANLGCGGISNSSNNPSVQPNGTNYNFTAPVMAGVGTMPSSIIGVTTIQSHHIAMPDPFSGKYSTDIPAGMTCQNFQQHKYNVGTGQSAVKHLSPGCYTDFAPNGSDTYTVDPGVYYINNADFTLNGNDTLVGTGVTIILTGTTPGRVNINGTSTVQLSAPTAANCGSVSEGGVSVNTCDYKKMLFIQSSNAAADNVNNFNGTSASNYDGTMYFPKGQISFNGTSGQTTKCATVVGYTVAFAGNTNLQNNTTNCDNNQTIPGKAIRLIA
jgi:hypothetical protein